MYFFLIVWKLSEGRGPSPRRGGSTDLALVSRREVLECWEAMHFDALDLVGRGVHLGDDGVGALGVLLSKLVPDGGQLFAVSAPWRVWRPREEKESQSKAARIQQNQHGHAQGTMTWKMLWWRETSWKIHGKCCNDARLHGKYMENVVMTRDCMTREQWKCCNCTWKTGLTGEQNQTMLWVNWRSQSLYLLRISSQEKGSNPVRQNHSNL